MLPKTGKKFPGGNDPENDGESYAAIVARALTAELGETHRAAKIVMRWTGASERTAKHWLAGTHGPCGDHLLVLMRESRAVLESVLAAASRRDAIVAMRILAAQSTMMDVATLIEQERMALPSAGSLAARAKKPATLSGQNDPKNDRNRDPDHDRETSRSSAGMNSRQSWFLEALRSGRQVGVAELEERWGISKKTARRDIAALMARGVIEFVGSRRSGTYRLIPRQ
jgi:hypothetical protein